MNFQRLLKHILLSPTQVRRAFPHSSLVAIEHAIQAAEATHAGEIRFVVEGSLDGLPLLRGQTPRERALELFSQLRIWDTAHNNGILMYVLLADRAVEIVADRGIHGKVGPHAWDTVCRQMEAAFKQSQFESGVIEGVQAVARHVAQHYELNARSANELADRPLIL